MVNPGPGVSLPTRINAGNFVTFLAAVSLTYRVLDTNTSRHLLFRVVQRARTNRRATPTLPPKKEERMRNTDF